MVPAITYGGWSIAVWNQGMSPRGEVLSMREIAINRIYQRPDGSWVIKPNAAERPSSVHRTLEDAERFAREMLKSAGGSVLVTTTDWLRQTHTERLISG